MSNARMILFVVIVAFIGATILNYVAPIIKYLWRKFNESFIKLEQKLAAKEEKKIKKKKDGKKRKKGKGRRKKK